MSTPTIGRIVHYYQGDYEAALDQTRGTGTSPQSYLEQMGAPNVPGRNGSRWHPAIITAVIAGTTMVNLTVFFADGTVEGRGGIEEMPRDALKDGHARQNYWAWPTA